MHMYHCLRFSHLVCCYCEDKNTKHHMPYQHAVSKKHKRKQIYRNRHSSYYYYFYKIQKLQKHSHKKIKTSFILFTVHKKTKYRSQSNKSVSIRTYTKSEIFWFALGYYVIWMQASVSVQHSHRYFLRDAGALIDSVSPQPTTEIICLHHAINTNNQINNMLIKIISFNK